MADSNRFLTLASGSSTCTIDTVGARVVSWKTMKGEQIYYSKTKQDTVPVRGGVPLCFPQFAVSGPICKHGFVKYLEFEIKTQESSKIVMQKDVSDYETNGYKISFHIDVTITLSETKLVIDMAISDYKASPEFDWSMCIHPYFAVKDIGKTRIKGFKGAKGLDKTGLLAQSDFVEEKEYLTFDGKGTPMDTMYYMNTSPELILERNDSLGDIKISGTNGYTDGVVWNIGEKDCKTIIDMEDDDWRTYVCVEPAVLPKKQDSAPKLFTTIFECL